jgi:hypothetical protein
MLKKFNEFFLFKKLQKFNKKNFSQINNLPHKGVLLIEFNSFHILHIIFSYLCDYFRLKNNLKIVAYYSHVLLAYKLKRTLTQKIKSFISDKLNLGFFGIYKSFGVSEFLFPKINKKINNQANLNYNKILKSIKSKNDILDIQINKVKLGDLIYDSYLTRNRKQKPTINIESKDFQNFLKDFLNLFFFWSEYFRNNEIKVLLVSHSIYTMGIPYRIALKNKIQCYEVKENKIKRHRRQSPYHYSEVYNYPKIFKKFDKKIQKEAIELANNNLKKRFEGINLDIPYAAKTAFNNKKIKKNLYKTDKFTILILPHDFIDAPHIGGKFAYADMYEWIKNLSELSLKKKNYNWLLKTHKKQGGKFSFYQNFTEKNIDKLIQNSNIKKLNSDLTHNQIIENGVDLVLTVFGTAAHEYAYKGIKVLNASRINPHAGYKFNFHISSEIKYKNFFNNLQKKKININKQKVLEFYYMHYIYNSKDWFFLNYNHMLKKLGSYHYQWSSKFYDYWLKNPMNIKFKKILYKRLDNFIYSNDLTLNLSHINK